MGGPGSLTHQVQEALKAVAQFGQSKRAARVALQAEIMRKTGEFVHLNDIPLSLIFGVKTMRDYVGHGVRFAQWARRHYGIRFLTQLRMETMATKFVREQYLDLGRSAYTVKAVLPALDKLAVAVRQKWGADIGRVDRAALGPLPKRRLQDRLWAGAYEPEEAEAIIRWVGGRRSKKAQLAALAMELQWRCGLRVSEACGLQARMVDLGTSALVIQETNITKGGRARANPLPVPPKTLERLRPVVKAASGEAARLWLIRPDYMRRLVRQACAVQQIETHGSHGFRHRFACDLYDQAIADGNNHQEATKIVSVALGHGRPNITRTYVRY